MTRLFTFGHNSNGQTGQNTSSGHTHIPTIVSITGISNPDWSKVSRGVGQGYGVLSDGRFYDFGYGFLGALGQGNTTNKLTSTQVGTLTTWASSSGGYDYLHAIKVDGTLWSCGNGFKGETGQGNENVLTTLTQVGTATNWSKVSAGVKGWHTLAVKTDGTLWAWGENDGGGYGIDYDASTTSIRTIVYYDYPNGIIQDYTEVRSYYDDDYNHTVYPDPFPFDYATKTYTVNIVYGYDKVGAGALGDGTSTNRLTPVKIGTDTTWSQVSAGSVFSLALKTNGTMWSWGSGLYGELGLGNTNNYQSPQQIGSGTTWTQVSAGVDHSAAIKSDGTIWTWGRNNYGQLGHGDTTQRNSPTQIGSGTTWSKVSCGLDFTLAVKTDGTLWAFGLNSSYQLGLNDTTQRNSPTQVTAVSGVSWIDVFASNSFSLAVTTNATSVDISPFNRSRVYNVNVQVPENYLVPSLSRVRTYSSVNVNSIHNEVVTPMSHARSFSIVYGDPHTYIIPYPIHSRHRTYTDVVINAEYNEVVTPISRMRILLVLNIPENYNVIMGRTRSYGSVEVENIVTAILDLDADATTELNLNANFITELNFTADATTELNFTAEGTEI